MIFEGSTAAAVVALAMGSVALLLIPQRPRLAGHRGPGAAPTKVRGAGPVSPARRAVVGVVAVGAAALVLEPGLWWVVLPASAMIAVVLSRRSPGRTSAQRAADRRLIAVHAELLAACLDAGMAVGPALRAVGEVLSDRSPPSTTARGGQAPAIQLSTAPPPPGDAGPLAVLEAVASMLALGADPGTAWRVADLDDDLAPLAAAARRSAAGGAGLAQAVREHAAQLRQETAAASVRAAGRAGVLMTAPLGVCFLPAFLCLGLAPVVVGLLGQLEIF